jgi:hypothetical protein
MPLQGPNSSQQHVVFGFYCFQTFLGWSHKIMYLSIK